MRNKLDAGAESSPGMFGIPTNVGAVTAQSEEIGEAQKVGSYAWYVDDIMVLIWEMCPKYTS